MNEYSYKMFSDYDIKNLIVDNKFLSKVGIGEYCFVEDRSLLPYEQQIEKLIIYKWNRKYPVDLYLDISLMDSWNIIETKEFMGSSHEKITMETYIK